MDCQLKQTAFFGTDERSRRRPLQRHYEAAGFQTPLPDVLGRVVVGWRSEAAADALEIVPGSAVPLVDQAALRASSARVARIDKHDCNAFKRRLVDDQGAQFVEPPVSHPCPLAPLNLDPIPDAFEVFEGDQAPAAFGVGNDGFAQDVVGMALKARLLAAIALERTSRGTSVDLLQGSTPRLASAANDVDLFSGVRLASIIDGQVDDTHVYSKRIGNLNEGSLVCVTGCGDNPLPAHEHQIDLPFSALEHFSLPITAGKRDTQTPVNSPNRDSIFSWKKAEDPFVVRLRGMSAKLARFVLRANLKRIRDLGDAPDRRLSREPEALTHRSISQMVQVELPCLPSVDGEFRDPCASSIATLKGVAERDGLIGGRQKANGGNELQELDARFECNSKNRSRSLDRCSFVLVCDTQAKSLKSACGVEVSFNQHPIGNGSKAAFYCVPAGTLATPNVRVSPVNTTSSLDFAASARTGDFNNCSSAVSMTL